MVLSVPNTVQEDKMGFLTGFLRIVTYLSYRHYRRQYLALWGTMAQSGKINQEKNTARRAVTKFTEIRHNMPHG